MKRWPASRLSQTSKILEDALFVVEPGGVDDQTVGRRVEVERCGDGVVVGRAGVAVDDRKLLDVGDGHLSPLGSSLERAAIVIGTTPTRAGARQVFTRPTPV